MQKFIGRKKHLAEIEQCVKRTNRPYLVSLNGRGGVGKTYTLRQVHDLYSRKRGITCFPLIDFSQSKTRTQAWLMDFISQYSPYEFESYLKARRLDEKPGDNPLAQSFSQDEIKNAFIGDFSLLETHTRCIFLFDTLELVQDTLLFQFILDLAGIAKNSIFLLAGRRNHELREYLSQEPTRSALVAGNVLVELELTGFSPEDALEYINSNPAGRDLLTQQQQALYWLAERGLPIKLSLALDWLSRRLLMESLAKYSPQDMRLLPPDQLKAAQMEFERELVAQIATLGTDVDQAVYLMAHVNRRFNCDLLAALLPEHDPKDLAKQLGELGFVKAIEKDYFVLHDEIQRMINQHVWDANDPTREQRREISLKVIQYYDDEIKRTSTPNERLIFEIEKLYYELDVSLVDGYNRFKKLFKDLESERNIELAALALDTLLKDRPLPRSLHAFIDAYYKGWVLVRRQQIPAAIEHVTKGWGRVAAECAKPEPFPQHQRLLDLEVNRRKGELRTLLGYCYRMAGDWNTAVDEFDQGRLLHEQLINDLQKQEPRDKEAIDDAVSRLAETLNDIANLLRMRGSMDRARRYCKHSLLIREALGNKRAAGHCCYVMGMIMWETGNTSEAVQYLWQAREYYAETRSESLTRAWLDRYEAYILYRTGNLELALEYLNKAVDETSRNPALQDEHAEVLMLYSRIFRQRRQEGDLERAYDKARLALQVAERISNQYRICEACITLSSVLICQGKMEDVRKYLAKGTALAHENKYHRLEGVILEIEADLEFEDKNYSLAFNKYTRACQKATEFKAAVFERAVSKLGQRLHELLRVDLEKVVSISEQILELWQDTDRRAEYPDFEEEVRYISALARTGLQQRSLAQRFDQEIHQGNWKAASKFCDMLEKVSLRAPEARAENNLRRARLENSYDFFSRARMFCERAIRDLQETDSHHGLLGECYLLLSQVYWKLGNTAESAVHLDDAGRSFEKANNPIGLLRVQLERGYMYFRTRQFALAYGLLSEVQRAFREAREPVYLASTLNLMGRLARVDTANAKNIYSVFQEADRRGLQALEAMQGQDNWFISAEIYLTLSILHLSWSHKAARQNDAVAGKKHFQLSKSHHQKGWRKIAHIETPLLKSVYCGIRGKLAEMEKDNSTARQAYLDELVYATQTKHMRLLRALDLLESWLAKKPVAETVADAEWLIEHWAATPGLAERFPQVQKSLEWMRDHRSYIPEAK